MGKTSLKAWLCLQQVASEGEEDISQSMAMSTAGYKWSCHKHAMFPVLCASLAAPVQTPYRPFMFLHHVHPSTWALGLRGDSVSEG